MKTCDVPQAFELDLGYRKLQVEAGAKTYTDEVANAYPMSQYVVEDEDKQAKRKPAPEPDFEPALGSKKRS